MSSLHTGSCGIRTMSTTFHRTLLFFSLLPFKSIWAPKHLTEKLDWPNSLECFLPQKDRTGTNLWNFCHATARVPTTQPTHIINYDVRFYAKFQISYFSSVLSIRSRNQCLSLFIKPTNYSDTCLLSNPSKELMHNNVFHFIFDTKNTNFSPLIPGLGERLKHNLVH